MRPVPDPTTIAGIVLAGGRSKRMGGSQKCLLPLGGRALIAHAVTRARPQVGALVISANADQEAFAPFGPVLGDPVPGHVGPLAGVLAGLLWAAQDERFAWVASFAGDSPFAPPDLVARMAGAIGAEGADLAVATSAGQRHPVFALWPVDRTGLLRRYLEQENGRKVSAFLDRLRVAEVDYPVEPTDPFLNINEPADLERAEAQLAMEYRARLRQAEATQQLRRANQTLRGPGRRGAA